MKSILIASLLCGICHAHQDTPKHARVSVQFVEVSHPVLTELLGGEETSGGALHAKVMALSKTGEAKILETSMVVCRSGQMAAAVAILEEIYPTEYGEPISVDASSNFGGISFSEPINPMLRSMTAFETKNNGLTLQVEPNIGNSPQIIDLRISPEFVRRIRLDTWFEHKDQWGNASWRMPVFEKWGSETSLILRSGKSELISVINPKEQPLPPAVSRRILLFVRADIIESP